MASDDTFELYDLEVTVEGDEKDFVCRHHAGRAFRVEGEDLVFPEGGRFSMYALAALIPLLPAKERPTSPNDWMTTDALIACPDRSETCCPPSSSGCEALRARATSCSRSRRAVAAFSRESPVARRTNSASPSARASTRR